MRIEPAGEQLYAEIGSDLCSYPQIVQVHAAVAKASDGLRLAGAARERYICDWDGSPGVEHLADIVQPLAGDGAH